MAEIVTGVVLVTAVVPIVSAGDKVAPAGTVTEAGTVGPAASSLVSVTTAPPIGAAPLNVTVLPVDDAPPISDAGDKFTEDTTAGGGLMVRLTVPLVPARVVTDTAAVPSEALDAIVIFAVSCVEPTATTLLKVTPVTPADTVAPFTKFIPVRVTGVVVPVTPTVGLIEASVSGPDSTIAKF